MSDAFARLRRRFERRRHRRLEAELTALYDRLHSGDQAVQHVAADLNSRDRALWEGLERLEAEQARLHTRVDERHREADRLTWELDAKAPVIWNALEDDLDAPLPPPASLLGEATEPAEEVEDRVRKMGAAQRAVLEAFGVDRILEHARADTAPLPAPPDRENYFGDDHLAYWLSGLGDALWLESLAERHGVATAGGCLLDFGCASGRVLRHFAARGSAGELLGADIHVRAVRWARVHLRGATIALTTLVPTLPLADHSVDVIYAGSVFTHIDEFEEATLLELRRVLKPNGIAVLTFHPGRVWTEMAADDHPVRGIVTAVPHRVDPPGVHPVDPALFAGPLPGERVVFTSLDAPINNTNVIHTHEYVQRSWGAAFAVEEIIEQAHGDHQDAVVLRRRG